MNTRKRSIEENNFSRGLLGSDFSKNCFGCTLWGSFTIVDLPETFSRDIFKDHKSETQPGKHP